MARRRTRNRLDERAPYDEEEERRDDEDELSDEEEDEEEDESSEEIDEDEDLDEDDEGRPRKKKTKKKSSKVAKEGKEKVRPRSVRQTRVKVVWGVFNNSNVQVATYAYPQEADARAHADRLTNDKKVTHFVQRVKVPLDEK